MIRTFRFVGLAAAVASGSSAQNFDWSQLSTSGPVRYASAMVEDASRQRVVLFGGYNPPVNLGDVWEWVGDQWVVRVVPNGPSARLAHAMAYDGAAQNIVVFGGENFGALGDTWLLGGSGWAQATPTTSPSARYYHAMAYDAARQRVLLFGGWNSASFGDTWEWDGSGWSPRTPANSPPPRHAHAMTYDGARQRVVLFGGWNGNTTFADTWEWDGTDWLARFSLNYPSPRRVHDLAYDAGRQRVVLFGGHDGTVYHDDSWEWDGLNWVQFSAASFPMGRGHHKMAYHSASQRVLLFGGFNGSAFGDTWGVASAGATAFGSGCGTPPLTFVPHPTERPVLGQSCSAVIGDAPTLLAAVAMGWSNSSFGPFPLPVTLAAIGMPGCMLWQSSDVLGLPAVPASATTLTFGMTIPNQTVLLGAHVYIQAYALAPSANPLQVVASNAIDWRIAGF